MAGKMVSDPRCTSRDIEAIIELARQKDTSLTDEHAEALRKLFDGPTHALTGERIFGGIPFGSTFDVARGNFYLFEWVFGKTRKLDDINFGSDFDAYTAALGLHLNAENPDLIHFDNRGCKLIMYSGSADSCVPYHTTLDYYERVVAHFDSLEKVQSFFRFYIVPGKDHGETGPDITNLPNMLDLVVKWREEGVVPDMVLGRRYEDGQLVLEMPLYPYPTKTVWDMESNGYKQAHGPRGGVERVAERALSSAAE
jgi:feruloyl esterase